MRQHIFIFALFCLTSCAEVSSHPTAQVSPAPIVPADSLCHLPTQPRAEQVPNIVKTCLPDGISRLDAMNVLGSQGTLASSAGNTVIYQWSWGQGTILTVRFDDDKLVSKSVVGS